MPTDYILDLLIAERDKLSAAIAALQGPARNPVAAAVPAPAAASAPAKRGRGFTPAQRKKQAERMKAYWAAKKAAAASPAKKKAA